MSMSPLPSGRQSLTTMTRVEVAQHQHERILRAMAATVAEVGYERASVSAVIGRARISRATFYEQFADKRACFLATYDRAVDILIADLDGTAGGVGQIVGRYLRTLAGDEAMARVLLLDVQALGAEGVLRRAANQTRMSERLAAVVGARTAQDRFDCEAFVTMVGALVTTRLAARDVAGLLALEEPLVALARRMLPDAV